MCVLGRGGEGLGTRGLRGIISEGAMLNKSTSVQVRLGSRVKTEEHAKIEVIIMMTLYYMTLAPFSSLQLMSAIKSGEVTHTRLESIIQAQQKITVDRSGGGL